MNDKVTGQWIRAKNRVPGGREQHVPRHWGGGGIVDGSDQRKPEWLPEGRDVTGEEDRSRGLTTEGLAPRHSSKMNGREP